MARILVIEDNQPNLALVVYLLEAFGHTTEQAADGAGGLALALGERFDLIVCDVQLPNLDGYAVIQRLKSDPAMRAVPVLAVTAYAMVGDRDQILAAGFDDYAAKPFVPETLLAQINALLPAALRSTATVAPVQAAESVVPAGDARARATILVVDDTPINHELMRSILEGHGYAMLSASSVREALALARERAPDLIVSDLHMPEQDGFDLLRALQADPALRGIKAVIHSATIGSETDREKALRLGAVSVVSRPLEPAHVLTEIAACLQAPGS
jgi:two-component system cell cycle response regulator